jgi:hypothetical protein
VFLSLAKTMVEVLGVAHPDHVAIDPLDESGIVVEYRPLSWIIGRRKELASQIADGSTAVFEVHGRHSTTSPEVLEHIDHQSALVLDRWVVSLTWLDDELKRLAEEHKARGYFDLQVSSLPVMN